MIKINQVYTKQGDQGKTSVVGDRIAKNHPRVIAIGEVDELNAFVGFAIEAMKNQSVFETLQAQCLSLQQQLFNLGAQLCVLEKHKKPNTPCVTENTITELENQIDSMNKDLPELNSFILPGGGEVSARLHLARTVCRRAERALVSLDQAEKLDGTELPFINRLSDWFFVAARFAAVLSNEQETLWER